MNLIALLLSLVLAGPHLSVALVKKTVKVHWQNTPGNQQDWITVVPKGTPDDVWGNWIYLKGKTSGTFVVQDLAPGQYEARLYLDWPKGKFDVVERADFSVDPPAMVVNEGRYLSVPGLVSRGSPVVIKWFGAPGNMQDWITVVPQGTPDKEWGQWMYLKGKTSGTFAAQIPEPGKYEVRIYFDWPNGGFKVVERMKFVVR